MQAVYMANVKSDVIVSIVVCKRNTLSAVDMQHVGNAPGYSFATRELVSELDKQNFNVDWMEMATQPVWLLELLALK